MVLSAMNSVLRGDASHALDRNALSGARVLFVTTITTHGSVYLRVALLARAPALDRYRRDDSDGRAAVGDALDGAHGGSYEPFSESA